MAMWTWLHRLPHDLPDAASRPSVDLDWLETHATATINTHRAWHALHVLLTGTSAEGDPPASWVVGPGALALTPVVVSTEEVSFVAAYLTYEVSFEGLLAARYPRLFKGADSLPVYSFEGWGEPDRVLDMVECGLLRTVFDRVRAFYVAAAAAHEIVVKHRG
jgi:hypothetical protein